MSPKSTGHLVSASLFKISSDTHGMTSVSSEKLQPGGLLVGTEKRQKQGRVRLDDMMFFIDQIR